MLVAMATTAGSENLPTERSIGYDTDCKQAITDTLNQRGVFAHTQQTVSSPDFKCCTFLVERETCLIVDIGKAVMRASVQDTVKVKVPRGATSKTGCVHASSPQTGLASQVTAVQSLR